MAEPASSTDSIPWSRSSAACFGCRKRKQKCDGERPVCTRCRGLSQSCIWPTQQKRGPTKGYTEALENRLLETERALLRLISVSSDDTLRIAFPDDNLPQQNLKPKSLDISYPAGTAAEKKSVITYWDRFPLQNADDVRAWSNDHVSESRPDRTDEMEDLTYYEEDNSTALNEMNDDAHGFDTYRQANSMAGVQEVDMQPTGKQHSPATTTDTERSTKSKMGISKEFQEAYLW